MMKIAFIADAHLGQTQYGIPERGDDYAGALRYAVRKAIDEKCDVLIFGGDMFHVPRPPSSAAMTLWHLCEEFAQSRERDVCRNDGAAAVRNLVLSIDGNHDNTEGRWMTMCGAVPLEWRGDVGECGHPAVYNAGSVDGKTTCRIAGIDGGNTKAILAKLDAMSKSKEQFDVLVMHLPLAEMSGFPVEVSAKTVAAAAKNCGVKLVLLGDIHDAKETVVDGIRFVYSGSPEVTAWDESPDKSFVIADFDGDSKAFDVRRIPIPVREQISVSVESEDDLSKLANEVKSGPLYHVRYSGLVENARERIASIMSGANALFRCMPLPKTEPPKHADRKGFRASFAEIVEEDFGNDAESKDLLTMLILAPDDAVDTLKKYLRRKGVKA